MVYPGGHSGWSVEFTPEQDAAARSKHAEALSGATESSKDDESAISVVPGLHCGPAGRRTLLKWIEDNYKLRKKAHHANPGVLACRMWQESQGFSDPVAKAIVDLLRLNGVPANVTYREVFQNHLCKLLSTLITKSADDKERCVSACASNSPPQADGTRGENGRHVPGHADTAAAVRRAQQARRNTAGSHGEAAGQHELGPALLQGEHIHGRPTLYVLRQIAPIGVKRKILAASPEKLYEAIVPLIEDALFLLDLGILEDDMRSNRLYGGYEADYRAIIAEIVALIGPPQTQAARIVYFLVQQTLRVMFARSVLTVKSVATTHDKNKEIDYGVWFGRFQFEAVRLQVDAAAADDPFAVYRRYAEVSVGLLYNLERNADETVRSVGEMRYSGNGCWNLSAVRHSITTAYEAAYMVPAAEMQAMEPFIGLAQLISSIGDRSAPDLPTDMLHSLAKPRKEKAQHLKIRVGTECCCADTEQDDMELFDVAFMLSHPVVVNRVLAHVLHYVNETSAVLVSAQNEIGDWISLLSLGKRVQLPHQRRLGLSAHYIVGCKFLLEAELQFSGESPGFGYLRQVEQACFCRSFLKASKSAGKPVSLAKLLSYVYPVDKVLPPADRDLPPFVSNLLTLKPLQPEAARASASDKGDITFHQLLLLYLPRVSVDRLKVFIAQCATFYGTVAPRDTNDASDIKEAPNVLRNILGAFRELNCDPREHIQRMAAALQKQSEGGARHARQLVERLHGKFKFVNSTVMGVLLATSNITDLFMKLVSRAPRRPQPADGGENSRRLRGAEARKVRRQACSVREDKADERRVPQGARRLLLALPHAGGLLLDEPAGVRLAHGLHRQRRQTGAAVRLPPALRAGSQARRVAGDAAPPRQPPQVNNASHRVHLARRLGEQLFSGQENARKLAKYTTACDYIERAYHAGGPGEPPGPGDENAGPEAKRRKRTPHT
ncbi:uncharacterized protein BcabD6B2_23890 [Babesia caballi]|uniref:Uncharacterized protein n=1 Tax=Babesia caballi TaxID=5871 RepID=A0AAV4LWW3_BABCB|nr:hypothetical protein, conserved [Babesia caballi]